MRIALTLLFLMSSAHAQNISIGVAPISIPAWGKAENVHMAEIGYGNFGLHFFLQSEEIALIQARVLHAPQIRTEFRHNAALSYRHPVFEYFRVGLISFLYEFPEPEGSRLNLWLGASYDIGRFRFSYNHISNAFMGRSNLGYDSLSVSFYVIRK